MPDFLLELRSEEIPARMQAKAREDLARLFAAELGKAGISPSDLTTYATPRRLALIARDLPDATQAVREEIKGPRASAPPQALDGFLRKTGLTREQLTEHDGVLYAIMEKPGRATADVLAEAIPAIVRAFPWPKSMRWGAASTTTDSLRWVRPLSGIVAILGEYVVPCTVAGIESGATTFGHRFHHPGPITIGGAHDYVDKLRMVHVIVDQDARAEAIRDGARAAAAQAGLTLVEDEGLVAENAGLTEWPMPLLGHFDPEFLDVPPEVIQLTARVNQKYFVCRDDNGALANAFVLTANIDATDGGAKIVEGNRKVLAARLADARFFYEQDLRVPLEEQAAKLGKIVFHEKLGTVADKVDRVAKLARWLVEEGIVKPLPFRGGVGVGPVDASHPMGSRLNTRPTPGPSPEGERSKDLAALAERAARLCKADLVTGMVGEFPELQGLMGGYYAIAQDEDPQVAEAIHDHYKPVGQGDDVPTAPVTVAVSLADKLDTIAVFFFIQELPSGSRDPFALRRAALSVIRVITSQKLRFELGDALQYSISQLAGNLVGSVQAGRVSKVFEAYHAAGVAFDKDDIETFTNLVLLQATSEEGQRKLFIEPAERTLRQATDFFADRLKVQQREAGVRHDLIDAVFAPGGEDDLVRLLARVHALQAFVGTEDGANLLAGYKRAANILKKEGWGQLAAAQLSVIPANAGTQSDESSAYAAPGPDLRHDDALGLSYIPEPAEHALVHALDTAGPSARTAVAAEDFAAAMASLASLRAPIDAFFETVTVNDADPTKRLARLALLARVRDACHTVADFSRIEG